MDGRSELLAYLGSSLATIAVLFGLQSWYASYLDVFVVNTDKADVQLDAKVTAVRTQEAAKLGSLPDAKQAFAKRGRAAFAQVAPKSSDDLSAMSGWIYNPAFAAYVPRAQPKPVAAVVPDSGLPELEGTAAGEAAVEGAAVVKPIKAVPQAPSISPTTVKVAKPVRVPGVPATPGTEAPKPQAPQPQVQ